ncbi:MerR family transcriptional regulator [Sphingomonas floccifaciens]|uniref:MerR family transcriptional regulator n=1 Tax=Sphingomonas floccifaciens TaxID=1844115 RepID=A0ABW4NHS3_9SPHN
MDHILTVSQFTPAEVEKITGVSTMTQRDWRRRGFLEKRGEGHARYDLFDLGHLLALKLLSDRGVPLDAAADVANFCGMGIGYRVLQWVDAYEGDHLRTNEARGLPETFPTQNMIDMAHRFVAERGNELPADFGTRPQWGEKGEWLARQVYRQRFETGVVPAPLFIWWADGQHVFHDSFDKARSEMTSGDARLAGPALVLDFASLASVITDRAGRAFVHVEFPDLPPEGEPNVNAVRQSTVTEPGASAPGQHEDEA